MIAMDDLLSACFHRWGGYKRQITGIVPANVSLVLICTLTAIPHDSPASGFRIPGSSIAGLATTDALVANPNEAGAMVYNPAAMSFSDAASLTMGMIFVEPKTSITPAGGSGKIDDNPDSPFQVPDLFVMYPLAPDWRFGLNISAPFGLETNWPAGTFPAFVGPPAPFEPSKTRLEMVNINPNISYRLNNNLSIAVGLDYYEVREAVFDTQAIHISSDGSDTGWNMAALHAMDNWSIGVSYRSNVKVDLSGNFDATPVLGFAVGSKSQLDFPDMLQMGVRYEVNSQLAIEFDIERTYWGTFKNIVVTSSGTVPAAGIVPGTELIRSQNNWRDTNSYHLGGSYDLYPDLQLRFGYTYNENPQPESYFSNRYPNSRRQMFAGGAKYIINNWDIEGGLLYAQWKDRSVNNTTPYAGGDPNGTAALNGNYELSGFIFGIGITSYF